MANDTVVTEANNNAATEGEATEAAKELTGSVATDGSTSMQKVINALGESFVNANPNVNFTYNPTGFSGGIKAVASGTCDIGLSSRALKDEEAAEGLVGTVLAYDGIAIVVNPENPVADLDLETIAKIYTGEIT
ncbi:MAG: substrate-binding domain-containing protein, partial [Clostridia bacterium]|nr:substrate-binding domain-containing protein [Clostridia bacterium]